MGNSKREIQLEVRQYLEYAPDVSLCMCQSCREKLEHTHEFIITKINFMDSAPRDLCQFCTQEMYGYRYRVKKDPHPKMIENKRGSFTYIPG